MRERGSDFDGFVASAAPGLLRMSIALTGDRGAAEDLLQDVLERMYAAWPRIDDPVAYGRRALSNASANRWRSRTRKPEHPMANLPEGLTPDPADAQSEQDRVRRAIASLPSRQRVIVVLRFLEDLSEADTARTLGCSTGTVKSQTARALTSLRRIVGADEPSLPMDDRRIR